MEHVRRARGATSSNPFRIARQRIGLLTWSSPNDRDMPIQTRQEILEFLETKGLIADYIICQETHKDGTKHFHAVVTYKNKICTTDQRFFDYKGVHPNLKALRRKPDVTRAIAYCRKDDKEPLTNMDLDSIWTRALKAQTFDDVGACLRGVELENYLNILTYFQ
jgi:hypothetical protein